VDATTIATLSKLIGLGLAVHKGGKREGFDEDDVSALKAFLDAGLLSRKSGDKPVAATHLAMVTRAFGAALGEHWANDPRMAPGSLGWVGDRIRKIIDAAAAKRYKEIELRLTQANLKLIDPSAPSDPKETLARLEDLTIREDASSYFEALRKVFINAKLDDEGTEPFLSFSNPGDPRDFEKLFRLAYAKELATSEGQRVQLWQVELSAEKPLALQHALIGDMAGWGGRHVFGNAREAVPGDILPFMPLDDVYVEPLGEHAEITERKPIKQFVLELLEQHHVVVVTADFGHGKSLTARSLAKDLSNEWLADGHTSGFRLRVPVFIKSTRDVLDLSYDHARSVRRARMHHAKEALGLDHSIDDEVFEPVAKQETLFILDGLDEISYSSNQLKELFQRLGEQARGGHRAVVFTRPGALHHGCVPGNVPVVDLLPFEEPTQIEAWMQGWNRIAGKDRQLDWQKIEAAGKELAATPILLLMIAMTPQADGQARTQTGDGETGVGKTEVDKTELYERFFVHIARGKLEQDRGAQHHPILEASERLRDCLVKRKILKQDKQPVDAMLWLMSRVAWMAHELAHQPESPELLSPSLPVRKVDVEILDGELGLKGDAGAAIELGLVLAMQVDPRGDSKGILFGHQSFREFLVARYWAHELQRLVDSRGDTLLKQDIEGRLMKGRLLRHSDEIFSMLSALLGRMDVKKRERIHEWAQEVSNDEELSDKTLRGDRSLFMKESALAIGSTIGKIEIHDPMTLRALLAVFFGQGLTLRLDAPGLICERADLIGANLSRANLSRANLSDANLSDANLFGANLFGANLFGADLIGASLSRASLSRASLIGASLIGANLIGANLIGADLSRDAILSEANLSDANLSRANLNEVDLSRANLSRANLSRANLSRANLSGADLSGADLSGANLSGADLSGADLSGAKFFERHGDLSFRATYTSRTVWPDGFQPDAHGAMDVSHHHDSISHLRVIDSPSLDLDTDESS
jgi:uncharacterized protein YjbI with pentapeptide repeats